jgi:DNA-binding SARP family transcriptional activator
VVDALWPRLAVEAGGANLRKAAHHARHALSDQDAVVLRGGQVSLFPSRPLTTDVGDFEAEGSAALASGDPQACAAAASRYAGGLLPEALYQDWTQSPRERLRARYLELLRCSGQWERLAER